MERIRKIWNLYKYTYINITNLKLEIIKYKIRN